MTVLEIFCLNRETGPLCANGGVLALAIQPATGRMWSRVRSWALTAGGPSPPSAFPWCQGTSLVLRVWIQKAAVVEIHLLYWGSANHLTKAAE